MRLYFGNTTGTTGMCRRRCPVCKNSSGSGSGLLPSERYWRRKNCIPHFHLPHRWMTAVKYIKSFPSKINLMRFHSRRMLTNKLRMCKYRLSRARKIVECSFVLLNAKKKLWMKPLNHPFPSKISFESGKGSLRRSWKLHSKWIKSSYYN